MKILAIRGKNLASLEGEFNIDFNQEPLKSAGIFAISGSTGSGKSTILDALCLALYDNTPRTNSAGENINIQDVNDSKINQRDSRTILRRGSAQGYAAAEFISLSGERYLSQWSVRRARARVDGSLQGVEIRLTNLNTNIEEQGTKTELLAKIVELTGLTFEQFTRAVLLAQGDFATFLKAKKGDKAELLEKLTGTDIYSRISIAIYEKSKEAEQELKNLQDKIKETELLSPQQLESFLKEKEKTEIEIKQLEKEIKTVLDKLKWITDNNILTSRLDQSKQELLDVEEAIQKAANKFELIDKYNQVQDIRDSFNELENLKEEIKTKEETKLNLEKEIKELDNLLEESVKKLTSAKEEKEKFIIEYNSKLPQIKKAAELDLSLNILQKQEAEAKEELKRALTKTETSHKELENREKEIETKRKEVEYHFTALEKHKRFETIIQRKESLNNYINDYVNASKMANDFIKLKNDSQKSLESQVKSLKSLKEREEILMQMLPEEIAVLRTKLQDGNPCPVCGSIHHPFTSFPLKENTSQQTLQENELNREKKELALQIERIEKSIKLTEQEAIRAGTSAGAHSTTQANLSLWIDNVLGEIPDWKTKLEGQVLQNGLQKLYGVWDKHAQEHTIGLTIIKELEIKLGSEIQNYKTVEETLKEKQEKTNKLTKQTQEVANERNHLLNGASVKTTEEFYSKKSKEIEESIEGINKQYNILLVKKSSNQGVIGQMLEEIIKNRTRRSFLDTTMVQWIETYNNSNIGLGNNFTFEQVAALLLIPIIIIKEARTEIERLTDLQKGLKATIVERQKNLENHQKESSIPSLDKNKENFENQDSLENLKTDKQIILGQTRDNLTRVQIALINHQKAQEKIASYTKAFQEKEKAGLNWRKLNDLYGSANGSKFKEIAQGYTLDALLTYANVHLKELSGRYELQRIEETLGLQVADLDMLGEVRAVHSLSGGESFLISLALALGLSSLSSSKMRIESLFIDEGFGSLDIDTLRTAMDALERLQTMGRKIGVISHVAEMSERVGVQIKVNKIVNGRSQIEICH